VEDELERAEKALKQAKHLTVLLLLALAVGGALLIIDSGIKKAVLAEAEKARGLLTAAQRLAADKEAADVRTEAAGDAGSAPGAGEHGSNGVVRDAAPGAAVAEAVRAPATPRANGTRRVQSRAPRNG